MSEPRSARLERALDEALRRALHPPEVPPGLRNRVQTAVSRSVGSDLKSLRERLEAERRRQLQDLEADYVRVRRSTVATLVGAAFVAGAAVTFAMPWLRAHFGPYTPIAITWGAVALGLGMVFAEPLHQLLQRGSDLG